MMNNDGSDQLGVKVTRSVSAQDQGMVNEISEARAMMVAARDNGEIQGLLGPRGYDVAGRGRD